MKKVKSILALALCAAMLLSMVGCTQAPAETTAPPTQAPATEPTELAAEELYAQAQASLDEADHISLELVVTTHIQLGDEVFSERSSQTLTYKDMGTDNALVVLEEKLESGIHKEGYDPEDRKTYIAAFRDIWTQGTLYSELDSTYRYQGPLASEEIAERYLPVVLLDAGLYGEITAQTTGEGTFLTFSQPAAAEGWAIPADAELVEAAGTALVDPSGVLQKMTYTITYLYGPTRVTMDVCSCPMDTPKTVTPPANPDTYTALEYIDILRRKVTLGTRLFQADSVTVTEMESLFSQAAGVMRNQSLALNLHGQKQDTQAKLETNVFFMDYSTMESQEYQQEELLRDGCYTYTVDGGEPVEDAYVTWKEVRAYAEEVMSQGITDFTYWENVAVTELDSLILLEFDLTDAFGEETQRSICDSLWENPNFLSNLASKYTTRDANGYLSIDKYTGLPEPPATILKAHTPSKARII